jgi:4-amino-4-deoxy-L-arabinose transferase-like glycosyltransferase
MELSEKAIRPYRIALGVLIVLICACNVLWILTNVAPPRMYDDAIYLTDSVRLVHTLHERGLLPFLRQCASATKGHPPMIKILPVPFYLLFGTGTAQALYAYTALVAIFCVYLSLLARALLHSEEAALFAVVFCTAFPLTYGMWRNIMAEFGTTVAVVACLYHLLRSDGWRVRRHAVLCGLFFGWGMLWKLPFPIFVLGPMAFLATRRRKEEPISLSNLAWCAAMALMVAGPFYVLGGRAVIGFARYAARSSAEVDLWSLGPVFSPKTVFRYWLSIVNFGISPYLFAVLALLLVLNWRNLRTGLLDGDILRFLGAWLLPPLMFFSFQILKEIRHILPIFPAIAIAGAALLAAATRALRPGVRMACLALMCVFPAYLYVASSFDTRFAPRKDWRLGPLIFSIQDLELASLQLIPTYTFPANSTPWPSREIVSAIVARASVSSELPSVRMIGENPYLSGFSLVYQSFLSGTPISSHGPFDREDPRRSDFSVVLCGPEHRYGPLDFREPREEALVADPRNGFQEIARVRLPSRCDAVVYKNSRKLQ